MSMISRIITPTRAVIFAAGAALGALGYTVASNEILYSNLARQRELGQILEKVEHDAAKTCEEISGRLATTSPDLAVSCRIGYNKGVANARQALKAW